MRHISLLRIFFVLIVAGCGLFPCRDAAVMLPVAEYHAPGFNPAAHLRVLLLPLGNETGFPYAADQIRTALAAEVQSLAYFEVVMAPPHSDIDMSQLVHTHGRFHEAALVDLARAFNVDAILLATVTQYSPYSPPRIGLSLQLISPGAAVLLASIDGLWDGRQRAVADQACAYYREGSHHFEGRNDINPVLTSPQLFQRFVCRQAAEALLTPGRAVTGAAPGPPPASQHPTSDKAKAGEATTKTQNPSGPDVGGPPERGNPEKPSSPGSSGQPLLEPPDLDSLPKVEDLPGA
jgi:hypothetical protein